MSASFESGSQTPNTPLPVVPDKEIEIPSLPRTCKATTVGLVIDKDATEDQLVKAIDVIERRGKGCQWQLGDALVRLKEQCPDRALALLSEEVDKEREGQGYASRKQASQVSCRFPQGTRVPSLSWSHHRAAAFFDTLEERLYWINKARDEGWSVRDLEKSIKDAGAEPEPEIDPDLFVLQDPAVRAYLETDIENQRKQFSDVPENAPFLRDQLVSRIEASQWQLNRTVESDCDIVREAVCELLGTWQQVFNWLKIRNRIISPPDVRAYLGTLVAEGRVIEEKDEKPNPLAKGTTSTVYKPKRNPTDDKKDEERRAKQALV